MQHWQQIYDPWEYLAFKCHCPHPNYLLFLALAVFRLKVVSQAPLPLFGAACLPYSYIKCR